jgi:hypothetical protein
MRQHVPGAAVRQGLPAATAPGPVGYHQRMCRSIRPLHNFTPPATEEEMRNAALQYVRKVAGFTRPSQANAVAFDEAVEAVAGATRRLVNRLVTSAPPRTREVEQAKARERWQRRASRGRPAESR